MVVIRVWNGLVTSTNSCSQKKKTIQNSSRNQRYVAEFYLWRTIKKNCLSQQYYNGTFFFVVCFFLTVIVSKEKGFKNAFFLFKKKKTFFFKMFDFHGECSFSSLKQFFLFSVMQTYSLMQNFFLKNVFKEQKSLKKLLKYL